MKITTSEQLDQVTHNCTECFKNKLDGSDGKRAVVLCGGTGCLSSNSDAITAKFKELVEQYGIADKVTVNQVGCFGFCSQGPFVKIFPEDTLYRLVTVDDVEEIVNEAADIIS